MSRTISTILRATRWSASSMISGTPLIVSSAAIRSTMSAVLPFGTSPSSTRMAEHRFFFVQALLHCTSTA